LLRGKLLPRPQPHFRRRGEQRSNQLPVSHPILVVILGLSQEKDAKSLHLGRARPKQHFTSRNDGRHITVCHCCSPLLVRLIQIYAA
jgi:hypothetical protein